MHVAVLRRHGREGRTAVGRLEQAECVDPDFVLVLRIHVDVVEIERARSEIRRRVHVAPARAGIVRSIQPALGAGRFDHRIHDVGLAARDVEIDLADEILRQPVRQMRPMLAAVGGLVDAAFGRGTAADDVPAFAESAVHAGVQLVRV